MSQSAPLPQTTVEKTDNPRRQLGLFESLSALILVATPVFYVLGRIYSASYWEALGASGGVMSVSSEDYIYLGFVMIANGLTMVMPSASSWSVWFAPVMAVVILAVLAMIFWVLTTATTWLGKRMRKVRRVFRHFVVKQRRLSQSIESAANVLAIVYVVALVVLALSVFLLLPIAIADSVATARAERVKAQLDLAKSPFHEVEASGIRGKLVECTERYCAIYVKPGALYTVPVALVDWAPSSERMSSH